MFSFRKTKSAPGWMAFGLGGDGIYVVHVVRPPTAQPSVEVLGFFLTEQALSAAALEKVTKEAHAERYRCSLCLSAGDYQVMTVDAPNVPPEELKTAIRWRLKDMLDYHVDDATIDVMDIPLDKNGSARTRQMFAIAARNQLIQQRQAIFAQAKIPLSVIDLPEMAQRNIAQLLEPPGRGLAMLSFDARGGLLTITYNGELYLSRYIEMPLSQLEQQDESRRNECYDRITLELQRSLDHFDRQYNFITMSKLMVAPMGDAGPGLLEYLKSNLYLPVDSLALDTVFDISKVPELKSPQTQQRFFLTLGAALRLEEAVL